MMDGFYIVVICGLCCLSTILKMHQYDIERERDYYKDKAEKLEILIDFYKSL